MLQENAEVLAQWYPAIRNRTPILPNVYENANPSVIVDD